MINKVIFFFLCMLYAAICFGQSETSKYYFSDTINQKFLISRIEKIVESQKAIKSDSYFISINFGYAKTSGIVSWKNYKTRYGQNFIVTLKDSIIWSKISKSKLKKFEKQVSALNAKNGLFFENFKNRVGCKGSFGAWNYEYYLSKQNNILVEYVQYSETCFNLNNDKLSNSFNRALSILVP